MSRARIQIENEEGLQPLAARLADMLRPGDVVTLTGDLGAGKTALARALIRHLAGDPDEEVPSPTFTLVQTYDLPAYILWHFDLYRLEEEERDILELGWDEARQDGVALVEWPQRLGGLLPKNRLEIEIGFIPDSDNKRLIQLTPQGSWEDRLKEPL